MIKLADKFRKIIEEQKWENVTFNNIVRLAEEKAREGKNEYGTYIDDSDIKSRDSINILVEKLTDQGFEVETQRELRMLRWYIVIKW